MTIRLHAAPVAGAFLISLLFTTTALAGNICCSCVCVPKAVHHVKTRPAPAHVVHRYRHAGAEATHVATASADVEYAQSYYDYTSSSTVSEGMASSGWVQAPDDGYVGCLDACEADYGPRVVENLSGYFNGGVGYGAQAGFTDGFGETHFAVGGFAQSGYGSYGGYGYGARFRNRGLPRNGFAPRGFGPRRGFGGPGFGGQGGTGSGY